MSYAQFSRRVDLSWARFGQEMLAGHPEQIKAKKEATAVRNLEQILLATLRVSNQKGFAAMTVRDLSAASGLSMGALYDYFASKEELLEMVQASGRRLTSRILGQSFSPGDAPSRQLASAIRTHIYLSEALQPWFFFSYMEARHLGPREKERAKQSEMATEGLFERIITQGQAQGDFGPVPAQLVAGAIKALLQDWYLKRWKFAKRKVKVDDYADFVVNLAHGYCRASVEAQGQHEEMQPWI